MDLNILTAKTQSEAHQPIEITEIDFWKHYLHLLNLRSNFWIAQKELEIFAWILSKQEGISWFSKPHSDKMKEEINNLSDAELTRVRKRLINLNLVVEEKNPNDKRKNITLPTTGLRKLQNFIKKSKSVNFIFPYEITGK